MPEPFSLPVTVTVEPAVISGSLRVPVTIQVVEPSSFHLPLGVTVFDASLFPGHNGTPSGGTFSVRVQVGGEDYTDRLRGQISIDAEEGAARVATLDIVGRDGTFEPDEWINLPVLIDYQQGGAWFRLFTGIVDLPELSIDDSVIGLSCTDNLQSRFEAKTRSYIESLFAGTGAQWNPAVFGDYETSARFAEDLLSTLTASADLDCNGQLVFGDWYLSGYDYLFSDNEVFPESVSVEWSSRRELINSVRVELEYTYQYLRERKQRYLWAYPRPFVDYLEQNTSLPNSDSISQAADVSGWQLVAPIIFERLPESGEYDLPSGGSTNWVITDELRQYLAVGADFTLQYRWVQDLRETHAITINSPPNIDRYGLLEQEDRITLDSSVDTDAFEKFEAPAVGDPVSIGSDSASSTYDSALFQSAIDTLVARANATILDSHRLNSVSFRTLIQPELERHRFVRLESAKVTAQGKVRRIQHTIDLDEGAAVTDIDLAVIRGEASTGTGVSVDALVHSEPPRITLTQLDTAIQVADGSVPKPADDFEGYVGNELPIVTSQPFDERFSILVPEISEEARDALEGDFSATAVAPMFNQDLTVNL